MQKHVKVVQKNMSGGGGFVYFLAFIGALVYFLKEANTFSEGVVAFLKAIVWPALLIYNLLDFLSL